MSRFLFMVSWCTQAFHNTLCCEEMDCVWVRHASPQRTRNNECFVSTIQECCEFFKTLVNNLAAPRLVTYQPERLCSVTTCNISQPDTLDKCDAVCRIIGGRSPSYDDLWDSLLEFMASSGIPIASFLWRVRGILSHFSPLVFVCLFSPSLPPSCIPPLHCAHNQIGPLSVYSLFCLHLYFLLSLSPPFPLLSAPHSRLPPSPSV